MSGVHMTMRKKEKYEMQTRMSDLMKRGVRRGAEKKVNTEEQKKNEKENENVQKENEIENWNLK